MSRFDWDDLRVFLAVQRSRSVRAAAKSLDVSHSTVSRRLETLERRLGTRLFDRTPDGFAPTAVGGEVLLHAERVESELFGMERDILGRDAALAGPIRITMPPPLAQLMLMPHLARFAELYPAIEVELICTYVFSDLSRRDADIAIRFSAAPENNLVGRRLPDFADAIYATPRYVAQNTFSGAEPTARWIGWEGDDAHPDWVRRSPFPGCAARWQVGDLMAQVEAARQGLGMALIPCWIGDSDADLARVPPGEIMQARPGWVLTHPDLRTSERVRVCVRFLVDALRSHEALITGQCHRDEPRRAAEPSNVRRPLPR